MTRDGFTTCVRRPEHAARTGSETGCSPVQVWDVFRELSWRQRGLLVRAWLLFFVAAPALRLFGFRRTQAALTPGAGAPASRHDIQEAQALARLVHAAANRNPFRPNCLARSLVLCHLLRLRGLAAELRIGVAAPGGAFAAHAWVEHGGVALAEAESSVQTYAPFDEALLTR